MHDDISADFLSISLTRSDRSDRISSDSKEDDADCLLPDDNGD